MSDTLNTEENAEIPLPPKRRGRPPKAKDPVDKPKKPRGKKLPKPEDEKPVPKKRDRKPADAKLEAPPEPAPEAPPETVAEPAAPTEPLKPRKSINLHAQVAKVADFTKKPAVRWLAMTAAVATLVFLYLFVQFRGLSSPTAMDQAQIARSIASGDGFSTKYLRPFAIRQLEKVGKPIPTENFPDFFQSPLNPLFNALPLKLVESSWKLGPLDVVYIGDRMIAATSILFFLLSMVVWFLIARRLFDQNLAVTACAIILLTDLFWEFSLSGLPQMLMLLIFSGVCWTTLRALEKKQSRSVLVSAAATGLLFGLMILAHGAAAWIFLAWLVFAAIAIRPRALTILSALVGAAIVVAPWLWRNHIVCGHPLGIAGYELLAPVMESESGYLRSLKDTPTLETMRPIARLQAALRIHTGQILSFLGMNFVGLMFFASLLHKFPVGPTARFRWAIVLMWLGAWLGMALCGVDGPVHSNQLHILFLPVFVFYGLAFLMELWNRLEIPSPAIRRAFPLFLILLSAMPLISRLVSKPIAAIQWPPYVPPFIAILGEWYGEKEIIASDMPWAVAWYANRHSLLLPQTIKDFSKISDFRLLGESLSGIYLTPVTGNRRLFSEIYKGPYDDWVLLIERPPPDPLQFILPFFTPLPIDGECILFADRDRWSRFD
ncbi:MAG: glycosyltransferase family 39 protein [Terrimicrobiaceae bacterium]